MTTTTHTLTRFRRLGSEAEAADRAAGHVGPITDADLASALAGHHADDLDELASDEERAEAIAALVEGYRHGG
jgi:hypothetical protein